MKKKHIVAFIVIAVFCLTGAGLVYAVQKPKAVIPYEKALSKISSPYTDEELAQSDSSYLQDPSFDVTADNFQQCMYDFLAAPARLYYGGNYDPWYKCDAPEINIKFAEVFKDLLLYDVSKEEFNGANPEGHYGEDYLRNELGQVTLIYHPDPKTYVAFERGEDAADYFCIDGELSYGIDYAAYKVADYSIKAGKLEIR